jgi:hypothetical protein
LKALWINTQKADKHSKWENDMSNRRTWIMKVNQLFNNNKIYIADHLTDIVKEFENHYYKEWGKKDWETDKINDDALDALRYFIFNYKVPTYISKTEQRYRKIKGAKTRKSYLKRNRQI